MTETAETAAGSNVENTAENAAGGTGAPSDETAAAVRPGRMMRPLTRILFWAASLGALAAAGVAVIAGAGAGWHGVILLSGVAFAALLVMYALAAGDAAGRALSDGDEAGGALARQAMDALSDPVLVTGKGGRVVWANAAYRNLARPGMVLGAGFVTPSPERLFTGAGAGAVYRLTRAAGRGERARESLGRTGPGEQAAVYSAEVSPMPGGGAVWRFSEARSEDELDAPVAPDWADRAPVGLFLADAEGRVLAANATLRGWLGAGGDEALKVKDFLTGDTAAAFARSRGAAELVRLDARLKARGGLESPVVLAIEWGEERPPRARCVVYGLSPAGAPPGLAQLAAGSGPARAGRTFDDMFSTAPFGVARLDGADPLDAVIEDSNPSLVQLSGGEAVPGARFADLFSFGGNDPETVFSTALAGRGDPSEAQLKAGGKEREVHVFFAPARGGKRAAYITDMSGMKALEKQIAQASKMQAIGQLASGVAHDFNNMLTAITMRTGELLQRHPVGDPSYQYLQEIRSVATRQASLVKKLMAFSRKQTLRLSVFDVTDVLSDCSIMLKQILEENVRLEIRHGRDLPLVRCDKVEFDNILLNLATNARDAMKPQGGGVLTITTEAVESDAVRRAGAVEPGEGRWAAIHVSDTGAGMDEQTRKKIFEPFFTTKASGEGTGLGLATVYGVVKQSGGYLFVDSEPGKGTTFHIFLPAYTPAKDEAAQEPESQTRRKAAPAKPVDLSGAGRILLVEDEAAVRSIVAKSLTGRGYEVVQAGDGEEALEKLEAEPESFDLLISDVVMPGLDGPGLLEKGRHLLGSARIMFISGYAEEDFSDMLSNDLAISFLSKPFEVQELAERVKMELSADRS